MSSGRPDYNLMTAIKGQYAGSLVTIAVDASGNIIGVLKGDYEGSPQTLAVDAQGRILAVLSDPADVFGTFHYLGAAELAARLGCISTHERSGQVLLMDDFESGVLKWTASDDGGLDSSVALSTLKARSGAFSAELIAGAAQSDFAEMQKDLPYPVLTNFGLEVSFETSYTGQDFHIFLYIYTGSVYYRGWLKYDPYNDKLYYLNSGASFTELGDVQTYDGVFNVVKLVLDLDAKKYVSALFNSTKYDLSAQSLHSVAVASAPFIRVSFNSATSARATLSKTYVDDVIVTQNEE